MTSGISLIVGLGNPGPEYEHTRHNAGAWLIETLAARDNAPLRLNPKFHGLHSTVTLHGHDCHLLIPTTFMNRSGQAVQALLNYYKIPATEMLVAHDEIDLPIATLRLKFDGGHGGHNGLRNIMQHINTQQFHRLRIGVGHPGNSKLVEHYVLSAPSKHERNQIDDAMLSFERILPLLLRGEIQKATMELHSL